MALKRYGSRRPLVSQVKLSDDRVVRIFNEMGQGYDDLRDLWYAWLFSRLHYFIARDVLPIWNRRPRAVIDIGCGTGFQSFLYAATSSSVLGVDIADSLVAVAVEKLRLRRNTQPNDLFPSHFDFVDRYHGQIQQAIRTEFPSAEFRAPRFEVGSALDLPCEDASVEHVNCCGSVLSFLPDYEAGLNEIQRVLTPGGSFVLEVEAKLNFDLIWPLIDASILRGRLGYDSSVREALSVFRTPRGNNARTDYPFGEPDNPVYMDITLFSRSQLLSALRSRHLMPTLIRSIHSITNLLPSTVLDSTAPSSALSRTFRWLSSIEEQVPFYLPGCSLVVVGQRAK